MASNEPSTSCCPGLFAPYCPECLLNRKTESSCAALSDSMEGPQVELTTFCLDSQLALDDNSPFYNIRGYEIVQTFHAACLLSIADVDPEQLGKNAH